MHGPIQSYAYMCIWTECLTILFGGVHWIHFTRILCAFKFVCMCINWHIVLWVCAVLCAYGYTLAFSFMCMCTNAHTIKHCLIVCYEAWLSDNWVVNGSQNYPRWMNELKRLIQTIQSSCDLENSCDIVSKTCKTWSPRKNGLKIRHLLASQKWVEWTRIEKTPVFLI